MSRHTEASDRVRQFDKDLEALARLGRQLAVIEQRMADCRTGTPGSGFGGSGTASGGRSPVERALMGAGCTCDDDDCKCHAALTADAGRAALAQLDSLLHRFRKDADDAHRIVGQWAPRAPDAKAKRIAEQDNTVVAECHWTRKMIDKHEDVHRTSTLAGVVRDPFPEPVPLCRFVYDFARRTGKLPTPAQLTLNQQGRTVRVPA